MVFWISQLLSRFLDRVYQSEMEVREGGLAESKRAEDKDSRRPLWNFTTTEAASFSCAFFTSSWKWSMRGQRAPPSRRSGKSPPKGSRANTDLGSKMTDVYEGSLIRLFRRLEELLRQMAQASKTMGSEELEKKFETALTKVRRDLVAAQSLYL